MMNGGGGKAPVTIGINPTIAFFSIILGGACALAAYTEKYRRDQDEIDDRLKERYFTNMKEQQAKMPMITQTIRGQDARLDDAMNKWVWGGKADLSGSTITTASGGGGGGGGGNTSKATLVAQSSNEEDEPSSSSSEEDELDSGGSSSSSTSDSSDSDSSSITEEERELEKTLSKKERRQRRKERKQRREARRTKREEEKRRLEAERQKLVFQSVAAGAAVGAVAVAITMVVGNRRN